MSALARLTRMPAQLDAIVGTLRQTHETEGDMALRLKLDEAIKFAGYAVDEVRQAVSIAQRLANAAAKRRADNHRKRAKENAP